MVLLFSHLAICCGFVFFKFKKNLKIFNFFLKIPIKILSFCGDARSSPFTSANTRVTLVSKGQAGAETPNCHMVCAFLFLGRGGDRNLLPSLRQRQAQHRKLG